VFSSGRNNACTYKVPVVRNLLEAFEKWTEYLDIQDIVLTSCNNWIPEKRLTQSRLEVANEGCKH